MGLPTKQNLKIYQGSTFSETFRYESDVKIYKTISSITKAAPAVITATAHGLVIGWRFKVLNVVGMKEINSDETYHIASQVTSDDITINALNTLGYTAYTSGGIIEYNEPKSLAGLTARMQIRPKLDSETILDELTTENGGIIINNTTKIIQLNISATDTAAFTFKSAVYSMELIEGSVVTPFIYGSISLEKEVTR